LAGLARVEPQVLEQLDTRSQLGQAGPDRVHRVLRVGCALRAAQVAARGDRRTPLLEPLDGGQRGADAQVVADLAVAQRDVEVGPQQDALAVEVAEVFELWDRHDQPWLAAPTRRRW
jgi:hypothetical protein